MPGAGRHSWSVSQPAPRQARLLLAPAAPPPLALRGASPVAPCARSPRCGRARGGGRSPPAALELPCASFGPGTPRLCRGRERCRAARGWDIKTLCGLCRIPARAQHRGHDVGHQMGPTAPRLQLASYSAASHRDSPFLPPDTDETSPEGTENRFFSCFLPRLLTWQRRAGRGSAPGFLRASSQTAGLRRGLMAFWDVPGGIGCSSTQ